MNKDKCCGNCKRFENNGFGWCVVALAEVGCEHCCPNHEFSNNGWTEITPDNVKEVYNIDQNRLIVQDARNDCYPIIRMVRDFSVTISTMAKCGGYYYYVLPELKVE